MKLWNLWRPAVEAKDPSPNSPENAPKLSCPFKSSEDSADLAVDSKKSNIEQAAGDKKED